MSSGFFGFFAHAGFLAGLQDLGLTPDAYAGSSSGALVAAMAAGGAQPHEMLEGFSRLVRDDFWDPIRPAKMIRYLLKGFRGMTGYIQGRAFERILEQTLPAHTFEQCAKPCLIVALDPDGEGRVVFTQGPMIPSVVASGAVPMLFAPVEHQGRLLLDGGMIDKAPLVAAAEHFKAQSMAVHLLPSSSLEKPPRSYLKKRLTPLSLFNRAIDASRQQVYDDQLCQVKRMGVRVMEARSLGQARPGPNRLELGPVAFEQARRNTRVTLRP